ncbi:hypothetical protein V8C26DRAFT_155356 [Trichoderma gracile]
MKLKIFATARLRQRVLWKDHLQALGNQAFERHSKLKACAIGIWSVVMGKVRAGWDSEWSLPLGLKGVEGEREKDARSGRWSRKWNALRFCFHGSSGNLNGQRKEKKKKKRPSTGYKRRTGRGKRVGEHVTGHFAGRFGGKKRWRGEGERQAVQGSKLGIDAL